MPNLLHSICSSPQSSHSINFLFMVFFVLPLDIFFNNSEIARFAKIHVSPHFKSEAPAPGANLKQGLTAHDIPCRIMCMVVTQLIIPSTSKATDRNNLILFSKSVKSTVYVSSRMGIVNSILSIVPIL